MSTIEELRQRVEAAERRFGLIDEQERRYSERLIGLMDALEAAQAEKQAEAEIYQAQIAQLEHENGELRAMLHALLLSVEAGSRDQLSHTLHDLDARLSSLLGRSAPAGAEAKGGLLPEAAIAAEESEPEVVAAEEPVELDMGAEEPAGDAPAGVDEVTVAELEVEADQAEGDPSDEAPAERTEHDPVKVALQAVATLMARRNAGSEASPADDAVVPGPEDAFDAAPGVELLDEIAAEARASGTESPVAEMIERLAEEAQDIPDVELMAEPPAAEPAPSPARKSA